MPFIVDGTNGGFFPSWTTATRPSSPAVGQMGYNTTTGLFDAYTAAGWVGSLTNASQSIPKSALPTGSILQVVNATTSGATTTTISGTYVSTAITGTITPTSSTSKILIFLNYSAWTSQSNMYVFATIYRNNTTNIVSEGSGRLSQTPDSGTIGYPMMQSNMYLDSPATTSATTYTLYIKVTAGTGYVNDSQSTSNITLMEIAA
jgi:hypothetical protein